MKFCKKNVSFRFLFLDCPFPFYVLSWWYNHDNSKTLSLDRAYYKPDCLICVTLFSFFIQSCNKFHICFTNRKFNKCLFAFLFFLFRFVLRGFHIIIVWTLKYRNCQYIFVVCEIRVKFSFDFDWKYIYFFGFGFCFKMWINKTKMYEWLTKPFCCCCCCFSFCFCHKIWLAFK